MRASTLVVLVKFDNEQPHVADCLSPRLCAAKHLNSRHSLRKAAQTTAILSGHDQNRCGKLQYRNRQTGARNQTSKREKKSTAANDQHLDPLQSAPRARPSTKSIALITSSYTRHSIHKGTLCRIYQTEPGTPFATTMMNFLFPLTGTRTLSYGSAVGLK